MCYIWLKSNVLAFRCLASHQNWPAKWKQHNADPMYHPCPHCVLTVARAARYAAGGCDMKRNMTEQKADKSISRFVRSFENETCSTGSSGSPPWVMIRLGFGLNACACVCALPIPWGLAATTHQCSNFLHIHIHAHAHTHIQHSYIAGPWAYALTSDCIYITIDIMEHTYTYIYW